MSDFIVTSSDTESIVVTETITEIIEVSTGIQGQQGDKGDKGDAGDSAYQVAVANGFMGNVTAWLSSLVGSKGDKGDTGDIGLTGATGASAYQVAVANGFVGTVSAWLASLVGAKGDKGDTGNTGDSAYQIAVSNGFVGSVSAWLSSLVGAKGDKGDKGDTGAQGTLKDSWRGAWVSGDFYATGDTVKYGGSSYLRTIAGAGTVIPSADVTNWDILAEKGADGTGSGTVTSVGASAPLSATVGATPVISMPQATTSVSGYLSSTDWNTFNSKLSSNQLISVTGDATGSGSTSIALTLPTVNSNVGTFNNVTVNAKGQVTAASNVSYLMGNQTITVSGDAFGSGATSIVLTLPTVNSNIGTYNNLTVNGKGQVTAASNISYMLASTVLDNIPSVSITSKISGDLLAWNGTNWVNTNLASAGIQPAGSYLTGNQSITLSGDITGSGTTSIVATLPNVNSNVGSFGSSSLIPTITVNAKGQVTGITTVAVGADASKQDVSGKNASNGYAGLTATFQINFKNTTGTVTSLLTNSATANRNYTFPDKDITVAGLDDITTYSLPTASATVLGGVKVDNTTITISGGVISATGGTAGHTGAYYYFLY